jgi:hypothetical protein
MLFSDGAPALTVRKVQMGDILLWLWLASCLLSRRW